MSLLERVTHTRERIHALQALKERAVRASEFEQRAQTLGGIAGALDTLCQPAAVLKQAGIDVAQLDQALLAALRTKAEQLREAYARDRSSILSPFPDQDFRHVFVTPCTAFQQRTEAALRDAWSGWVRSRMPAIDQEMLSVLSGVNALSRTVTNIQALLGLVSRHAAVLPQSADDVKQVLALCDQANQAWHELAGDGIAPEILIFLRVAGSGIGASYDLLTPSILEWLDAHNLRRVLRIRLG
jgi:hypothetical protein